VRTEKQKEYGKAWRLANKERTRETDRKRYKIRKNIIKKTCLDCGKIISFRSSRCLRCGHSGALSPRWKGGRSMDKDGYFRVLSPTHPNADAHGYVLEHRLVMEAHLGRTLLPTEVVHHINGITSDHRIENLALFSNQGEHARHHFLGKKRGR
jgi:hypothetical protein